MQFQLLHYQVLTKFILVFYYFWIIIIIIIIIILNSDSLFNIKANNIYVTVIPFYFFCNF